MRHRRRGRKLGRSSSHRKAMLRNLATSLILTERDPNHPMFDKKLDPKAPEPPKVRGRVVTTVQKAKEVRSLVEKCITIARKSLEHEDRADEYSTDAERNSDSWKAWRGSENWQKWNLAMAPALAARRRCLQLLGSREAVEILFDDLAPRFSDRDGGYTRVLRLATTRLGDAGTQAILELVGVRDRVIEKSEKPEFADEDEAEGSQTETEVDESADESAEAADDGAEASAADEDSGEESAGEDSEEKNG